MLSPTRHIMAATSVGTKQYTGSRTHLMQASAVYGMAEPWEKGSSGTRVLGWVVSFTCTTCTALLAEHHTVGYSSSAHCRCHNSRKADELAEKLATCWPLPAWHALWGGRLLKAGLYQGSLHMQQQIGSVH